MKKHLFAVICALSTCLFAVSSASAQLSKVCSKVKSTSGFIYKQSAPLRSGGVGTALIGYRKEPTLICNVRECGGTSTVYDKQGNTIGRCPWASAHGHVGGRYRCTMSTSGLRRTAVKNAKSPSVYFKLKNGQCVEVPDAGRCVGSVKGLCNQLIS